MWGGEGGWWIVGVLVMVICVYLMVRMMSHGGAGHGGGLPGNGSRHPDARDILAERFARGEISEDEFEERRRVLERGSS